MCSFNVCLLKMPKSRGPVFCSTQCMKGKLRAKQNKTYFYFLTIKPLKMPKNRENSFKYIKNRLIVPKYKVKYIYFFPLLSSKTNHN